MPSLEIQLTDNKSIAKATLVCESGSDRAELSSVQQQLELSAASEFLIDQEELRELIKEFNKLMDAIAVAMDRVGKSATRIIGKRKNAELRILVSEDRMYVEARIITAYGGSPVTSNQIVKQAQMEEVNYGFDKTAIVELAKKAAKGRPGMEIGQVIARGMEAVNGANARLEQLVMSAKDRILRPQEDDSGNVDMRNLGKIISVKPGTPIMRKHPATRGTSGVNVFGEHIETVDGSDIELKAGEGTYIDPKDPNVLLAECIGLPKVIDNGMAVVDVFEVPRVDVSTGHVEYSGSVIVNGDVGEGMRIIAKGDVNISGYVDSAYIEASGDIVIGQAAIGKQLDESQLESGASCSTKIISEGNVYINHAQYVDVDCQKKLVVSKQLLHSTVSAYSVHVGKEDKPDGKVIGGQFKLQHSLETGSIGATSGTKTHINLNQRFERIKEKKAQLQEEIETQKRILAEIKTAVEHIKFLPHNEERKKLLGECVSNFDNHKALIQQYTKQLKLLEQKQSQIFSVVYVQANEKLYVGVDVEISRDKQHCKREYGPSKIHLKDGKLTVTPLV